MWNCNDIQYQVTSLLTQYHGLRVSEDDNHQIRLDGTIKIHRTACEFILQKQYLIEIVIPKNSDTLPTVIDAGNAISNTYPHRYTNGSLCLETATYIQNRFIDGIDLISWMEEFVEPYFFSYEFYSRFGYFPFGERPHGLSGLIHTYQEFWNEGSPEITCRLLVYAAEQTYRGHSPCPCGSGKKTRQCHGPALLPFMSDSRRLMIVRKDLQYLRKELAEYEQTKHNNRKTK